MESSLLGAEGSNGASESGSEVGSSVIVLHGGPVFEAGSTEGGFPQDSLGSFSLLSDSFGKN